jgi:3-oxoacyl-[acyl-carrier-protein] synthase III
MKRAFIASTGSFLPEKVTLKEDLLQFSREAQSLIGKKTGVLARRHAGENQCTSDLALAAARTCMEKINFLPEDIEGIILSTSSPDGSSSDTITIPGGGAMMPYEKIANPRLAYFRMKGEKT